MSDSIAGSTPPARPLISQGRVVLGCIAIPVILVLLLVASALVWWSAENRRAARELAAEVQKIRDRGEPLTTVDVNNAYLSAPGRPDMTKEILAALAICDAADLKAEGESLPIVGTGREIPAPPENWEVLAEVEAFLAKHQAALDIFHDVARREGTSRYPVDFSVGLSVQLPHAQSLRNAARLLSLQSHVALHRGEPSQAVESALAILGLARTLDNEPILVSQLVRLAVFGVAVNNMAQITKAVRLEDADLRRLQMVLRKVEFEPSLRTAFIGERANGYLACTDPLALAQQDRTLTPQEAQALALRSPSRVFDAAMMLRHANRIVAASDDGLFEALEAARTNEAELQNMSRLAKMRYLLTFMLTPASHAGVSAFARSAAQRDATDAALAAELYRRKHGSWPKDLETLVSEFLPAVPVDPFDNKPLRVISTPQEFKVYSIGRDLKDNGGDFSKGGEPDAGFAILAKD